MSLKNCQDDVDKWASQFKVPYWTPHEMLACLVEELGEVGREINYRWGPKKKKATEDVVELGDELADILFTVCCLANAQKIDLDKHFARVMDKCYGRDNDRFEKK